MKTFKQVLFYIKVTIEGAILRDEIPAIVNNIRHYRLILIYRIRSLTEVINDNRIKDCFFKVRIFPIYEHAYMNVCFFNP